MKLTVFENHPAIAVRAAQEISAVIKEKAKTNEGLVLGLATGSTMEPVYAELIRQHREEGLDFSRVKFFNLDNYIGLPPNDRNNYAQQLHTLFLRHINASAANIDLVSSDINFDHKAYEERIRAAGGIDIQLLGIGRKGHIGFNEVGSGIDSITRQIELSEETIEDNSKYFNQIDELTGQNERIPLIANTMGIRTILEAKKVICLANGHTKAQALRKMYANGPIDDLPARALHTHANVLTLVDIDALALFNEADLAEYTYATEPQKAKVIASNQNHFVTLQIQGQDFNLLLPPQFDFYNPKAMDINEPFDSQNPAHLADLAACLEAAQRISVAAHPDDAEIMAGPMMLEQDSSPWLTITVTNGAASNNTLNGEYNTLTPEQLTQMRQMEQRAAAKYAGVPVIMCKFPTPAITGDMGSGILQTTRLTMRGLFNAMHNLTTVYGHNPFDEHDTHVNCFAEQVIALRSLSDEKLQQITVWGMEVWGNLPIAKKRLFNIPIRSSELLNRWQELISLYKSQIESQDRDYSQTTISRAYGHAGYHTHPHGASPPVGLLLGADLNDLVRNRSKMVMDMVCDLLEEYNQQTIPRIVRVLKDRNPETKSSSVKVGRLFESSWSGAATSSSYATDKVLGML